MKIRTVAGMACAGLVIAALTGCTPPTSPSTPAAPAPTSTSAEPSTSSPTTTPTVTALSTPTVDPFLPTAEPLTPGLLDTTDAAWLIAQVDAVSDAQASADAHTATATYLISPAGVRYQLPDLGNSDLTLLEWLPGTPLALATDVTDTATTVVVVDLETGYTTPVDLAGAAADAGLTGVDVAVTFVGDGTTDLLVSMSGGVTGLSERRALGGALLASADGPARLVPTPDGRALLNTQASRPQWVDPATLQVRAQVELPDTTCWVDGWLDPTGSVLTTCPGSGWYVANPDAATWQLPFAPSVDRGVTPVVGYPDGSVLVQIGDVSETPHTEQVTATSSTPVTIPVALALRAHGTVAVGPASAAPDTGAGLLAWNSADDTTTVLVPGLAAPAGQTVTVVDSPDDPRSQWLVIDLTGALSQGQGG